MMTMKFVLLVISILVAVGFGRAPFGQIKTQQERPYQNTQNTSTICGIVDTCYEFLLSHQMIGRKWDLPFHFYRPSLEKYGPYQWLWDSGSHMIVWSHQNVTNSIEDFETMLQMQQPDGRIPEIIFWGNQTLLDLIETASQYSSTKYVDLTQMVRTTTPPPTTTTTTTTTTTVSDNKSNNIWNNKPILPFSLRAIYNATNNITLMERFVPRLVEYLQWWANTRDVDGDGLVSIIHGWESGLDASPMYDAAFFINTTTNPHPTYDELYPKFDELIYAYKLHFHWNQSLILGQKQISKEILDGYFIVQDVGVNSVYAAGWGILADLASLFDPNLEAICRAAQLKVENSIIENMFNPTLNRFVTLYRNKEGQRVQTEVEGVQSLFPLLLVNLPTQMQESIVYSQLMNSSKFWLNYPIPSVSADAPQFEPDFTVDLMWRGPTWPILNWFIMEGLQLHGYYDEMTSLLNRWISLYKLTGVWEQYNPIDGTNYGVEGLGMSTLIVDWLYRTGLASNCTQQP